MAATFKNLARREGRDAGENAAHWFAQDAFGGRVTRGAAESARRILKALDECEDVNLPYCDLSGQWADGMTPKGIAETVGVSEERLDEEPELADWLADEYEEAYNLALQRTVERLARAAAKESK